ncbi:hypothetical protein N0V82_009410 [Gnomoniopsis sp. IMI 355080]|nr:hypothetical protein N0V82_009410 [Gnomoniopsis sp. IMI 355080]
MPAIFETILPGVEYPAKVDLRKDVYKPLPKITPGIVEPATMAGSVSKTEAQAVLNALNAALASNDVEKVADCFYPEQTFWRDIVAFTSHLRTFSQAKVVAAALLEMKTLRGIEGELEISGEPHFTVISPVMTDVFVIGAGTSGLMIAARLKALGVESIIADRNSQVGESWMHRHDSLKLHVPTSNCEIPYTYYRKELQSPHRLSKYEVAEHLQNYATNFHLNVLLSTTIQSSLYNSVEKKWTFKLKTTNGTGTKTIVSKHLVQATGIGSGIPHFPPMEDQDLFRGVITHSSQYRNAKSLVEKGVKSVAVIGSANSAFDVIQDCHDAGLDTTMVVRSPTYIFPYEYVMDPHGIGAYDLMPLETADRMLNTFPQALDGQFSHGLFAHLASQEPDRYLALLQAGFPVIDSRDPSADVQHHLVERGGGHYVDVGGTKLIAEGKVAVRGRVTPIRYTKTGLRLSDGTDLDADAVIWCTGFADKDVRSTAEAILGVAQAETVGSSHDSTKDTSLGPKDIAARLDATWGVDAEGEVRGMWKRHLRMENYWVLGGVIQHQRWWSRPLAQQIKLAIMGDLPPAYRETPNAH